MGSNLSNDEKEELSGQLREVLKEEYSTLRKDIDNGFKTEIENVQKTLKEEYSTLRKDIDNGFKTEIENVQKTLKDEYTTLRSDIDTGFKTELNDVHVTLKDEYSTLRNDNASIFKAEFEKFQKRFKKHSGAMETNVGTKLAGFDVKLEGQWDKFQKQIINRLKDQLEIFTYKLNTFEQTCEESKIGRKFKKGDEGFIGWCMLLTLTTLLLVAAIVLISSSVQISRVKPCELEAALDYISMEYNPHPCRYNSVRECSSNLRNWGIAEFLLNWFLFWAILCKCHCHLSDKKVYVIILVTAIVAMVFFIGMTVNYVYIVDEEAKETVLDYLQLESSMISWLAKHYKSDNISNGGAVSIAWNIFFIRYDCCGISEVVGTSNNFDNTPWCTTSGSCQATSSQIPKTCCRGVTKDDYQNAPSNCHASVNDGTYKPSCISRMKSLGRDNINESLLTTLSLSILTLCLLQLFSFING
uniref:Uncharacterized protein LOC111126542 isoform X2 n=1 Tax=Crassostrea virginica TaxID=6565 RepID=A0A8B8DGX5_CRAVI|nr:uncharacterized protein LOC111126542 isoform X2 [Crassostrea virginica]